MKKVIVRSNVVENVGVLGDNDGPPPQGTIVHPFNGFVSVGWLWNNGNPIDPNPPPPPVVVDQADLDRWDRKLRALALVTKPAGMTLAQFKTALKNAYDSLS